jgi:putative transposase
VRRTVPPSAEIEEQIERLLAVGVGEHPREALSELAKLGAGLIIQRAVEDEFDAWLGRARYERRPEAPPGLRNGFGPAQGADRRGRALGGDPPGPRGRRAVCLQAVSARQEAVAHRAAEGDGDRRVRARALDARRQSLCAQAGLGKLSKSTAARICSELRERFAAFGRRDRYDTHLAALFLDATFLAVRPNGPKEGVLVAWGFTEAGERVLLAVMLGMRESHEDGLGLARDLIARGLGAAMLIVADGAPGLIKAIEQCWPASDRQHCAVHRVRNLLAKLPERERERIRGAYWRALDEATGERDAKQRFGALVDELDAAGYTAAARCLTDDLDALVVHLRYPTRHRRRWRSTNLLERSLGEVKRRTKVIETVRPSVCEAEAGWWC